MPSIVKPIVTHPSLARNELGLTIRDYEGSMSTLCAGCGHDSVTAAIVRAFYELDAAPHMIAKLSGIGCSSKTPTYFVSGDGDSLSIGLGQMAHAIRRNVDMLYIVENNGVYGLTKGQFSATADRGSKSKRGVVNHDEPIDLVSLSLQLGASFVARSFSGDKAQLVPILKAGLAHKGFALVDVISPCVTFNDHEGSTKSYAYMKDHDAPLQELSFIPAFEDITVEYDPGTTTDVTLHDGSHLRLRKLEEGYDPSDRGRAVARLMESAKGGEVLTGVLFLDTKAPSFADALSVTDAPLATLPPERTRPPRAVLEEIVAGLR